MCRASKTILLIPGLWLAPVCWDRFRQPYEAQGYRVLTPAWPGMAESVAGIRQTPQALAGLGVREMVRYYEGIIHTLDKSPIVMGHGIGGLVAQLLLDRGLCAAGIAIGATAPRDVWRVPGSLLAILSPLLANPLNYGRTVELTFPQFHYALANTLSINDARQAYEQYAVAAPGRLLFETALANWTPWAATRVQRDSDERAPLLLIAGEEDRLAPASLARINHRKYASSSAITDYQVFPQRSHLMLIEEGWQEVADFALAWAELHVEHAESWLIHGAT